MKCTKRNLIKLLKKRAEMKKDLYTLAKEKGVERDPINQTLLVELSMLYELISLLTNEEYFNQICAIHGLEEK